MSRRSGFGGNVWEKSGICFQLGALRTVPEYSKTLLISPAARSILPTHTPAGPGVSSFSPSCPQDRTKVQRPSYYQSTDHPGASRLHPAPREPRAHAAVRARLLGATQRRRRAAGHPHNQDAYYNKNLKDMSTLAPTWRYSNRREFVDLQPVPPLFAAEGQTSVPVLRDADDALLLGNDHGHIHHLLGPLDPLQQDRLAG